MHAECRTYNVEGRYSCAHTYIIQNLSEIHLNSTGYLSSSLFYSFLSFSLLSLTSRLHSSSSSSSSSFLFYAFFFWPESSVSASVSQHEHQPLFLSVLSSSSSSSSQLSCSDPMGNSTTIQPLVLLQLLLLLLVYC